MSFNNIKGKKSLLGGKGEAAVEQRLQRIGELVKKEDELIRKLEANNNKMGSLSDQLGAAQSIGLKDIEAKLQQQIESAQSYATSGTARLSSMKAAKTVSANNQFKRSIGSLVSDNSMNADIAGYSRQSGNVGAAKMMAGNMSSYGIEQDMDARAHMMQQQKVRMQDAASDIGKVPGTEGKIAGLSMQWDRMSQAQGLSKQALARQVSTGGTLGQQEVRFSKMGDAIAESRRDDELTAKATMGGLGSVGDTNTNMKNAQDEFTAALKVFNKTLLTDAAAAGVLGKSLDQLDAKVKKAEAAAKINADINGGSGGGGILQALAANVTKPMRGFGIGAEEYGKYREDANVTSVMRQGQGRTGMARMANQNFGDQMGAIGGDASSLRRLLTNVAGQQSAAGIDLAAEMDSAKNTQLLGRGAQVAATGIDAVAASVDPTAGKGLTGKFGNAIGKGAMLMTGAQAVGSAGQVMGATAGGLNQIAGMATNAIRGNYAMETAISAGGITRGLGDEINKIPDYTMQGTTDYIKGITTASRGMGYGAGGAADGEGGLEYSNIATGGGFSATPGLGQHTIGQTYANQNQTSNMTIRGRSGGGRRDSLLKMLTSKSGRGRLAASGVGMTDADVAEGVGAGGQALGSQLEFEDIEQAGRLRTSGLMSSVSEGMQKKGELSSVGIGREGFDTMLRQAVAGGMDSSKNVSQMVAATTQMSQQSSLAGRSTGMATANLLAAGAQGSGLGANMAIGAATNTLGAMNDITGDRGINMDTLQRMSSMNKQFGGASAAKRAVMSSMTITEANEQVAAWESGKGKEHSMRAGTYGADGTGVSSLEDAKKIRDSASRQLLNQTSMAYLDERSPGLVDKVMKGAKYKDLNDEEKTLLGTGMKLNSKTKDMNVESFIAMLQGKAKAVGKLNQGNTGLAGNLEQVAGGAEATKQSKVFSDGVDRFSAAIGGLENLGPVLDNLAQNLDLKTLADNTTKAANNMELVSSAFGQNMERLDTSLGNFKTILNESITKMEKFVGRTVSGVIGSNADKTLEK